MILIKVKRELEDRSFEFFDITLKKSHDHVSSLTFILQMLEASRARL